MQRLSADNTIYSKPDSLKYTRSEQERHDQNHHEEEKQPHQVSSSISMSPEEKAKSCIEMILGFAKSGNTKALEQFHSILIRDGFSSRMTSRQTQSSTTGTSTYGSKTTTQSTSNNYSYPHQPASKQDEIVNQSVRDLDMLREQHEPLYDSDDGNNDNNNVNITGINRKHGNNRNGINAMNLKAGNCVLPGSRNNGNVIIHNNNNKVIKDQRNKPKVMNTSNENNVNNVNIKNLKGNDNNNEIGSNVNENHDTKSQFV